MTDNRKRHVISIEDYLSCPAGRQTDTYIPVSNLELYEAVKESAGAQGLVLGMGVYRANRNRTQSDAIIPLNLSDGEIQLSVGMRNSSNKTISVGVGIGARVVICENGMFAAELLEVRRHTKKVKGDLVVMLADLFANARFQLTELGQDRDKMRNRVLTESVVNELVGRLFMQEEILRGDQLALLRGNLQLDPHFGFRNHGSTLWNFYNMCTETLKKEPPALHLSKHVSLHQMLMEYA